MNPKHKLKSRSGGLRIFHWKWGMIFAISLAVLDVFLLWEDYRSGLVATAFSAAWFLAMMWFYLHYKPQVLRDMVNFATRYGQVQNEILQEFDIPAALLEMDGKVLWMNNRMSELTGRELNYRKNINTLFPELNRGTLPTNGGDKDIRLSFEERQFRAHVQLISVDGLLEGSELEHQEDGTEYLYMLYLFDETQLVQYIRESSEQKPVVGLVYIDNYEEVMEHTDEVHQSLLNVLVERRISKYFVATGGLVKKLEKDKYLIVLNRKSLDTLRDEHFSLMDAVKTINVGQDISLTVSGGFGVNGSGYQQNFEYARGAIEMALGRGGDQFVIKDGSDMTFYGGKTQHSEKNTRVKARVKAQALRELILAQDKVVTMGHALTDMDSFGAAVGVCRAAMTVGKPAHIVLGDLNTNIREWVQRFQESGDYPDDFFITHEKAIQMVDSSTAVVVVDTNRRSMVECPEILKQTQHIVVLDHHRQTTDTVDNAALSYIEPSASSACEMIAEILQYFEDNVRIKSLEADCIYAGIVIDTQSFVAKTGVRTFEAAAYLRRCGADTTRVRKALRDSMKNYKAKADAVRSAQTFMGYYALSVCNGEGLEDPNVVGAQAANDLLNIVGVKASFVATPYQNRVFISARSIDELNVQLVMERLGGGGHMNIAGAQLSQVTPEEALEKVKQVLKEMTQEGAI